ncbi:MFS transporter [Streptomyces spinosirectus]|jgi:EmrB/QacA subfamily drug resistance transporter|uniref:MFS transporter n=1 Tax=Streptomyces TaxID=1883 RepID=UPI000FFECCF8|nr:MULTISPECIES: MFS transporter [Streptomyces]MBY8341030.1 MFS transporter [Streptomyces plumbidurans]UIR22359.1 MFS transporter [Streptomyces spinosirectus]
MAIRDRSSQKVVLLAMCLGLMLSMFNSTMTNVALPDLGRSLHASDTSLQWVATLYTLTYAAALLLGGALGDRLGRRTAFLLGVLVFSAGSLLCTLAPVTGLLLGARAVQALGAAIMLPQTLSILVHEFTEPRERARAVSAWAGVASLGLAAGPVVGGALLSVTSWRAAFALTVLLGMVTWLLGRRSIPVERHGRPEGRRTLDVAGSFSAAVTLAALVFALSEGESAGWSSPRVLGTLVLSVLALIVFIATQLSKGRNGRNPLMPMGVWRSRPFIAANVGGFAYFAVFFGVLFFYSLDLQDQRGYSVLAAGFAFLPMTLVMALVAPVTGRLMARYSAAPVMISGLAVTAAGSLLLAAASRATLAGIEWRLALVGIGCGLLSSSISNLAVSSVPDRLSNSASAVQNTFRQIGSTLGVAVLGIIVRGSDSGFTVGLQEGMAAIGTFLAVCAVVSLLLVLGSPMGQRTREA